MRLAVLALTVIFAAGCGGGGTLSEKALEQENETVQSAAAEGALLASDVARGRTTEPFARIHAEKLAEQAKKAGEALRSGKPPAGLGDERRRAVSDAETVEHALDELHAEPGNRDLARRVESELKELSG
jgi:poly(3-hydroxybutyrate) depolymerase